VKILAQEKAFYFFGKPFYEKYRSKESFFFGKCFCENYRSREGFLFFRKMIL